MRVRGNWSSIGMIIAFAAGTYARAQTPCSPLVFGDVAADPLSITGDWTLPDDCTLDFGPRAVVLKGTINAVDLTIRARGLTVEASGKIAGLGGATTIELSADASHDGAAVIDGALVNDGAHGGQVLIAADGAVTVSTRGVLRASSSTAGGYGGVVSIEAAGPVQIDAGAAIATLGGEAAEFPGEVSIRSSQASLRVLRPIQASGGSLGGAGVVDLSAATALVYRGELDVSGKCTPDACSRGGRVRLESGGDLTVEGTIHASAAPRGGSIYSGDGNGGEVTLEAGGGISLAGDIDLSGAELGRGGAFTALAAGKYEHRNGNILANGRAPDSHGGTIRITAGASAALNGGINASGGEDGNAGALQVFAEGDVVIGGAVDISANYPTDGIEVVSSLGAVSISAGIVAAGKGLFGVGSPIGIYGAPLVSLKAASFEASGSSENGLGGPVHVDSLGILELAGVARLVSNGAGEDPALGEAGEISLKGCQVFAGSSAQLDARGAAGGSITIVAADALSFQGSALAAEGGDITVSYAADIVPDLSGASFDPAAFVRRDITIEPCAIPAACEPPSRLACSSGASSVRLSWERFAGQTQARVLRDGGLLATLDASASSFVDASPLDGVHEYTVMTSCRELDAAGVSCSARFPGGQLLVRGDCNLSSTTDISDAITTLSYLFQGSPSLLSCEKACDMNDDGGVDISDAIALLGVLFLGSAPALPPPAGECGDDPTTDSLTCESFSPCAAP